MVIFNLYLDSLHVGYGAIKGENESAADAKEESIKKAKSIQKGKPQDDNEKE